MRFASPAALVDAGEVSLGDTQWVEITQETIEAFADATDDHQWIHIDPDRAASGPFGGTVAHGYLTLSLLPRFLEELLDVEGTALVINAGTDRVRFVQPVRSGRRIRGSAVLLSAEPTGPGIRAHVRVTVEIEGEERPALVADALAVYVPA